MPSSTDLLHTLRSRPKGHSLPAALYRDPAVFELDLEAIFYKQWLFAGLECEVAEPGRYLAVEVGPSSVLVIRGKDGVLRAFHNACRHRGSRLCDAEQGLIKSVVCPYHRWTYRLDGTLIWAAMMPDDFDLGQHSLRPVALRTLAGTIYICLAANPPDFAPYAEALTPMLAPHRLEQGRVAWKDSIVVAGNWKLMMENSRECYHCAAEHRELMQSFLDVYDWSNPLAAAEIQAFTTRRDQEGLPSKIAEGPDYRAARLPFTHGAVSTTVDGKPAVTRLLGGATHHDIGSLRWVHYPSVFNHAMGDHAVIVRMLPIDAERVAVSTTWVVDHDAVEGEHYDLQNLIKVWTVTNEQDAVLVERNQRGVNGVGYLPGPYCPAMEAGVIKFVDWYCERLARHLAGDVATQVAA